MKIGDIIHAPAIDDPVYIYGLFDPADGVVRYVGKTPLPQKRLVQHIREARQDVHLKPVVYVWILGLLEQGRKPDMVILDITDRKHWVKVERLWIERMHERYGPLVNGDFHYVTVTLKQPLAHIARMKADGRIAS